MKHLQARNHECSGDRQNSDSISPNQRRLGPQKKIGSGHTAPQAIDAAIAASVKSGIRRPSETGSFAASSSMDRVPTVGQFARRLTPTAAYKSAHPPI